MGRFQYPFNSRIPQVPTILTNGLASNFRQAETEAGAQAKVDALQTIITASIADIWASRCGTIEDFILPSTEVPSGALLCYGQALTTASLLRTKLIAASNPFGSSGSDPLLPDLRGRGRAGLDNMGGSDAGRLDWANTLGTAGGAQYHTLTGAEAAQKAVTTGNPSANHYHTMVSENGGAGIYYGGWGGREAFLRANAANSTQVPATGTVSAWHTHSISASDAASGHNNIQPTILLNAIVWTGEVPS